MTALGAADVVIYLVDGKAGLSAADRAVADRIRATGVPLVLAVNKVDRDNQQARVLDFHALGATEPLAVSAAHGLGVGELWERVEAELVRRGRLYPVGEDRGARGEGELDDGDRRVDPLGDDVAESAELALDGGSAAA